MDGRRSVDVEQPFGAAPPRSVRSEDAARHAPQPDQGQRADRIANTLPIDRAWRAGIACAQSRMHNGRTDMRGIIAKSCLATLVALAPAGWASADEIRLVSV